MWRCRSAARRAPSIVSIPDGTHVEAYQPLALALGGNQPVYGISLNRIFSMNWKDVSIATLAADMAASIRDRQPEGPYHLLGWSNGGVIALAIADELERDDQSVAFLGILDTQPPVDAYAAGHHDSIQELSAYMSRDRRQDFLALPEAERETLHGRLAGLSEEDRIDYAARWVRERGFLSPEESEVSVEILKIGYALDRSAAVLLNAHRSRPIQAPVHVWWTANTLKRHGRGPIDWRLYTSGPVTEYTVAGDHMEAVQSLQVHQRIGEILDGLHAATQPPTQRTLPS